MVASALYKLIVEKSFDAQLVLCSDYKEAQVAYELLCFALPHSKVFLLPQLSAVFGDDLRSFKEEFFSLNHTLREFYACSSSKVLIAPIQTTMYALPNAKHLQSFSIQKEQELDLEKFKNELYAYGYEFVDFVEMEGEVSIRGDIIDLFVPSCAKPYRLSLFDIFVEEIKEFDLQTQRCEGEEREEIEIFPTTFSLSLKEAQTLQDEVMQFGFEGLSQDIVSFGFWLLQDKIFLPKVYKTLLSSEALEVAKEFFAFNTKSDLSIEFLQSLPVLQTNQGYADILFDIKNLENLLNIHQQKKITLLSRFGFDRLAFLKNKPENITCLDSPYVVNLLTPDELILSLNTLAHKKRKKKPKILLDELRVGEYVVHSEYGVGIFRGIIQTQVLGSIRDFIQVDYQGEDKLLVPVENLHYLDRYIGGSSGVPIVDRLGKGSFAKLRDKVKSKLFEIAGGIIELAAKRDLLEGYKIKTNIEEYALFERSRGFELTSDQEKSIQEIFLDLQSGKVMDRLLSGDVGFGKTEVAMSAMCVVAYSGYQSVLIVPTTLLALQHYQTLQARFKDLNFKIAKLDSTTKNKTQILNALKNGEIDMVVGTHSILGVEFKNLGLVIIDEEHKFGVKQKEKIKELSQNVHLLSMSATPIPRTLNMALSQIKGMSSLLTPPKEREGVRTFVKNASEALIKEVILRELRRNGQIFYIHNHISSIEETKEELLELLPHLKIATLHSQSKDSEKVIQDFADQKYQVLLCTSIVESGIHLSNANTMIVAGADRFGIADLHQLRGRVGRGDKEGFCYFLIEDKELLSEEAKKRLLALEQNSYLGSGASLAYHDLEIRGGGNLLGEAQSGHIKNIGYSLYLRMLEDCINLLSGKSQLTQESLDLKLSVSAYLNPELIASDRVRLELYRRLAQCKDIQNVFEIQEEIEERFGKLDIFTQQFLSLIMIKVLGMDKKIKTISNYGQNISITFIDESKKILNAKSKDDDDVLSCIVSYLRSA